jgi:hypothetical protein
VFWKNGSHGFEMFCGAGVTCLNGVVAARQIAALIGRVPNRPKRGEAFRRFRIEAGDALG